MVVLHPLSLSWLGAQATMDWEAQDEGVIAKILAPDGSKDIPVGTVVAVVVEDAEHVSASKTTQCNALLLNCFELWQAVSGSTPQISRGVSLRA